MADKYKTYRAMEQAVKAAAKSSGRDVNKAIQAFYHDRFLCRIFSSSEPLFILKGGQSMLARVPNARETRDIDLLGRTSSLEEALSNLVEAASIDLGDFIEFRFKSKRPTDTSQDYRSGYTVAFETWLGGTAMKGVVSIDLVVDSTPPRKFDVIEPVSRLAIAGIPTFNYLTNTAENRIAEKVGATMQDYNGRQSSRAKDLVDLVSSMINEPVNGDELHEALKTELAVRKIGEVKRFAIPNVWKSTLASNYRKLAIEAKLSIEYQNPTEAEQAIAKWLQPIFDSKAHRVTWNPLKQKWTGIDE